MIIYTISSGGTGESLEVDHKWRRRHKRDNRKGRLITLIYTAPIVDKAHIAQMLGRKLVHTTQSPV